MKASNQGDTKDPITRKKAKDKVRVVMDKMTSSTERIKSSETTTPMIETSHDLMTDVHMDDHMHDHMNNKHMKEHMDDHMQEYMDGHMHDHMVDHYDHMDDHYDHEGMKIHIRGERKCFE